MESLHSKLKPMERAMVDMACLSEEKE